MLKPSTPEVAECYARAQGARERANATQNLELQKIYLEAEQQWLKLAASCEATSPITHFFGEEPIAKHPICKSCGVAMWLVEIRKFSSNHRYVYECKACDARTKVEGKYEQQMSASETHGLSRLEYELIRARDLTAAGEERLDRQEKRVARLRAEKIWRPLSEQLLDIMRDTHQLQVSHLRLIEKEVREAASKGKTS